jgi:hypothetical protein
MADERHSWKNLLETSMIKHPNIVKAQRDEGVFRISLRKIVNAFFNSQIGFVNVNSM